MAALLPREQALRDVLTDNDLVNLTNAQANSVNTAGVRTVDDLILVDQDDLMEDLNINAIRRTRLKALISWAKDRDDEIDRNVDQVDVTEFTPAIMREMMRELSKKRTADDMMKDSAKDDQKLPEPFTGKARNWIDKKREFKSYLGTRIGKSGLPLLYVVLTNEDEPPAGEQVSPLMRRMLDHPLFGDRFDEDNMQVHQYLTRWTTGGNADTHIDAHPGDGWGAWLQLIQQYEGLDAVNCLSRRLPRRLASSNTSKSPGISILKSMQTVISRLKTC